MDLNELEKDELSGKIIKFTKILTELATQFSSSGYRMSFSAVVLSYVSDKIKEIIPEECKSMNMDDILYRAADMLSDDETILTEAVEMDFIPSKSKYILKYKILSYMLDSKKVLESSGWNNLSSNVVDDMIASSIKSRSSVDELNPKIKEFRNEVPDQDEALARGGMYLPKVSCFNYNGIGIVQFNYDIENLLDNDEHDD